MLLRYAAFGGQNQAVPPYTLPDELGQSSINTYVDTTELTPNKADLRTVSPVTWSGDVQSIYKHKNINTSAEKWLQFPSFTRPVRHPVADDTYQRLYYSLGGRLRYQKYSSDYVYDALYPALNPQDRLTINVTNTGTIKRFIGYTLVLQNGEETGLSNTTTGTGDYLYGNYLMTTLSDTSSITVTWDASSIVPMGGQYNSEFQYIRFYMTSVTTTDSTYFYIAQALISDGTITILDAGLDVGLQSPVTSPVRLNYGDVDVQGVCNTSFGSLVIWDKGTVYVSNQYQPTIFDAINTYSIDSDIQGVFSFGNSLLVNTTTTPYVIMGNTPSGLTVEKAENARAVINTNCVVDMQEFIIFPTDEGLFAVGTGVYKNITTTLISTKAWKGIIKDNTTLISAYQYKNLYILNLSDETCLVFDVRAGRYWQLDYPVNVAYYDSLLQKLYFLKKNTDGWTTALYEFMEDTVYLNASFTSGIRLFNVPVNLKYLRVWAEDYTQDVEVDIYLDGVLHTTIGVAANKVYKIPYAKASAVYFTIRTNTPIKRVYLADVLEELQGG
jgi:hypothetical protein